VIISVTDYQLRIGSVLPIPVWEVLLTFRELPVSKCELTYTWNDRFLKVSEPFGSY